MQLFSVFENIYVFNSGLYVVVASDKEIDFPSELMNYHEEYIASRDALIYTDDYVPISELG